MTGATVAKENSDAIKDDLKVVGVMFMVFAGIALFVGAFIIWNTFTMIITQRTREIALMRAIGATRRQVLRSLLLEAVLIGNVASAIGIGLGVGVAKGLNLLMDAAGFSLPSTSLQLEPRTVVISMLVGVVVTVVAALVPARRATKVLPVEALREATPGSEKASKRRAVIGLSLLGAGTAGVLAASTATRRCCSGRRPRWRDGRRDRAMPLAVRPLTALIAAPMRLRGLPGELAKQNAMRNTRRTASTAAALMIGLTLVVSMSVFASSLKDSFGEVIGDKTNADLFLTASSSQGRASARRSSRPSRA